MWLRFVQRPVSRDLAEPGAAERLYVRYRLALEVGATVTLSDGSRHGLLDLSYGGFSIQTERLPPGAPSAPRLGRSLRATLSLLGTEILADSTPLYHRRDMIGFSFDHVQTDVMAWLRASIPFLALGTCLGAEDDVRAVPDGSVLLQVFVDGAAKPKTVDLRFMDGKVETRATLTAAEWQTSHRLHPGGELGDLVPTREPDRLVLRKTILVFSGAMLAMRDPLINGSLQLALEHWQRASAPALTKLGLAG